MLFAHHIAIEFFGCHLEPEGVIEHLIAFSATAIVAFLASYGGYTLFRKMMAKLRHSEETIRRP